MAAPALRGRGGDQGIRRTETTIAKTRRGATFPHKIEICL